MTFKLDMDRLGEVPFENLLFLWYDEDNQQFAEAETLKKISEVTNGELKMLLNWRILFIPLIIYPHLISAGFIVSAILLFCSITDHYWMPLAEGAYSVVLLVCFIITIIATIIGLVKMNRSESDFRKILFMNMLIKLLHTSAYVAIFIIGLLYASTVIGMMVTVILILIDCIVIFLSGMVGMIGINKMKRDGKLSSGQATKYGICQFIFCIDVINAVVLYVKNVRE